MIKKLSLLFGQCKCPNGDPGTRSQLLLSICLSVVRGPRARLCYSFSRGKRESRGPVEKGGGGEGDKIWKGGGQGVPLLLLIFVVLAAAVGALDVEASTFKVTSQHLKRGQKGCSNISLFLSSSTCFYSRKEFFFFLFWRKWHVVLEQNMIWILIEEISAIITFIT